MGRLAGQVAVVFGGARGIGLATVKEFLAEGATVFASDIREPAEEIPGYRHSVVDATDDGSYLITLATGQQGWVTAGDLYVEDESGRYLGGPRD